MNVRGPPRTATLRQNVQIQMVHSLVVAMSDTLGTVLCAKMWMSAPQEMKSAMTMLPVLIPQAHILANATLVTLVTVPPVLM